MWFTSGGNIMVIDGRKQLLWASDSELLPRTEITSFGTLIAKETKETKQKVVSGITLPYQLTQSIFSSTSTLWTVQRNGVPASSPPVWTVSPGSLAPSYLSSLSSPGKIPSNQWPMPFKAQNSTDNTNLFFQTLLQLYSTGDMKLYGNIMGQTVSPYSTKTFKNQFTFWDNIEEANFTPWNFSLGANFQLLTNGTFQISDNSGENVWNPNLAMIPDPKYLPTTFGVSDQQVILTSTSFGGETQPELPVFWVRPEITPTAFTNPGNGGSYLISNSTLSLPAYTGGTSYNSSATGSVLQVTWGGTTQSLISPNKNYRLDFKSGGILSFSKTTGTDAGVLWSNIDTNWPPTPPLTVAAQTTTLTLLPNGDLWITDGYIQPTGQTKLFWSSNSGNYGDPSPPYRLVVTDSGHCFILNSKGKIFWDAIRRNTDPEEILRDNRYPMTSLSGPYSSGPGLLNGQDLTGKGDWFYGFYGYVPPLQGLFGFNNKIGEAENRYYAIRTYSGTNLPWTTLTLGSDPNGLLIPAGGMVRFFANSTGFGYTTATSQDKIVTGDKGNANMVAGITGVTAADMPLTLILNPANQFRAVLKKGQFQVPTS
jgi:hypothetical protein